MIILLRLIHQPPWKTLQALLCHQGENCLCLVHFSSLQLGPSIWMLWLSSKKIFWFARTVHFGIVKRAWILKADLDLTLKYVICYMTLSLKFNLFGLQFPSLKSGNDSVCRILWVSNDDSIQWIFTEHILYARYCMRCNIYISKQDIIHLFLQGHLSW